MLLTSALEARHMEVLLAHTKYIARALFMAGFT